MNNLSVTIITLNEQYNLTNCIISIKDLADEIILVDGGSSDKTIEIAKKMGAKVYHRKFDNFANQRNWIASKAKSKWILSVDADERIPIKLSQEIRQVVQSREFTGYKFGRRNFILGAEIKHSRWSPDKHIWLWQKNQGKWVGEIHEEVIVLGKVGQLTASKVHYSHKTVQEFFQSNNLYSTLLAKRLFKNGVNFSFWKMIWQALFEFLIRFFYKLGFLDGRRGFILAYLMAIYQLTVGVKLWELQSKK